MRVIVGIAGCLALLTCDSPVGPRQRVNTDLGLRVWTEVVPAQISMRDSTASLTVRVLAWNPAGHELRIRSGAPPYVFTADPVDSKGLEHSFRIANAASALNAGPGVDAWGDTVYVFAAFETQFMEHVVTIRSWRAGGWPLAPGTYWVRGYYNGREGASAAFRVVP